MVIILVRSVVHLGGECSGAEHTFDKRMALGAAIASHLTTALTSTVIVRFTGHSFATVRVAVSTARLA